MYHQHRQAPGTFPWRISLFALISLILLAVFAACEGETITIEQTEDGAVVRSTSSQQSELGTSGSSGTLGLESISPRCPTGPC